MPAALPPLTAFVVGVAAVVLMLVVLDVPAFVGLVVAAFLVGVTNAFFLSSVAFGNVPSSVATAFGNNMAGIGIPILMAAIIGKSMLESGAADRIVGSFRALLSDENVDFALWGSASFLAIPVFFDNVFYLMAPLARSLRARIGDNYALYIVVVGAGAATTHVFVPPTPGPLAVASKLSTDGHSILGMTILVGLMVAIPCALIGGIFYGRFINARLDIPLRDAMGTSAAELEARAEKGTEHLPRFAEAALPIAIAIVFVASSTVVSSFGDAYPVLTQYSAITSFVGAPSFALTAAGVVAAVTYLRFSDLSRPEWESELTGALKNGGNIAAITCAGGAFGAMLAASGIGSFIAGELRAVGVGLLVTAWLIAAVVRVAQGSATVAMLTTAGIMAPLVGHLGVNPAYLVAAIGAGANICSWYNDSGFWLVKEIGGLTQKETLKTWTALTTIVSVTGLVAVLVYSTVLPLA